MREIVVGVDGSASSRAALRWAMRVGDAEDATVRAVAGWQYPSGAGWPAGPTELPNATEMDQRTSDALRVILEEELGADADRAQIEVGRGPAARVLLASADRASASMLVLGARGLGGFDGLLLGSVTQECVEHARCPVVVLRDGQVPADGPVVVGLDGSAGAATALDFATGLAEATGAALVTVHTPGPGPSNVVLDHARQALDEWTAPATQRGLAPAQRVEAGDPRSALLHAADETDAAILVVGTRGLGSVRGLLVGSVAGHLVRYSTRPIAVVPADR